MCVLNCVWLFATPWTGAHQTPLSMEFSRQEYWSGLPFPSPGDLPNLVLNWSLLCLLHRQVDSLPLATPGEVLPNSKMWTYKKVHFRIQAVYVGVYTFVGSHSMFSEIHQVWLTASMPRSTLIYTIYPSVINECYRHWHSFHNKPMRQALDHPHLQRTEALRGHPTPES